jgi:hypothetical protein
MDRVEDISYPIRTKFIFLWEKGNERLPFCSFTAKSALEKLFESNPDLKFSFNGDREICVGDVLDFEDKGKGKVRSVSMRLREKPKPSEDPDYHCGPSEKPSDIEVRIVCEKV